MLAAAGAPGRPADTISQPGANTMKTHNLIATVTLVLTSLAGSVALAQDHTRNWENGHVVAVTHVHIKPGMTNAYMNDLASLWRRFNEEQMKDGDILEYKVYANSFAREGEPDLILTVTYKDWATFDRSAEYFEALSEKLMGSLDDMREAAIDREELRTIGSTFVLQEMNFMD